MKITEKHKLAVPTTWWEVMQLIYIGLLEVFTTGRIVFACMLYYFGGGIVVIYMFTEDLLSLSAMFLIRTIWLYYPVIYAMWYFLSPFSVQFIEELGDKKKELRELEKTKEGKDNVI